MRRLPEGFEPIRVRWFVEREDFGRRWTIQPTLEDADGNVVICHLDPDRIQSELPEYGQQHPISQRACLIGQQSITALYSPNEAQQLMDALWEAGMRPSRQ